MARLVMKFGGTSLRNLARIKIAAAHVRREWRAGHHLAVVVSAQAGETDRLVRLVHRMAPQQQNEEYDAIIATGEQVSAGLFALALQQLGMQARSWLGWQLPVHTQGHGRARIQSMDVRAMARALAKGEIAVMAGFQGVDGQGRISTLGRGGSDTSAVALAHALRAERCDIYTDVDGVYTADPRLVPRARRLEKVAHEEMLELASQGAKVLQTRAMGLAMAYNVPLQVCSSFVPPSASARKRAGTHICAEEMIMEKALVNGIAYSRHEAKLTLRKLPDRPGIAAAVFAALADANINVDMIVQNIADDGLTDVTFTVETGDSTKAKSLLAAQQKSLGYEALILTPNMAKISVIGIGMRAHVGVAQRMFSSLAKANINIQVISTSEIKVSVLIDTKHTTRAVQALHKTFALERKARIAVR